jgi:lipid II:glycine glycyltransferase (peptidoglycan interpeptide bridge formation enzyme)
MLEGRNLIKQMAERTKTLIKKAERRLVNLRELNLAQEDYVNKRFGMDISAFR